MSTHPMQKRSAASMTQFIECLRETGNISESARRVGISPDLAYTWRDRSARAWGKAEGRPADGDFTLRLLVMEEHPLLGPGSEVVEDYPFHVAWDHALEEAGDALEAEVYRRGVRGYLEPVVYEGGFTWLKDPDTGMALRDDAGNPVPLTIRKYSDRMLEILVKARRPEKFRENYKVTHEAPGSTGVVLLPPVMSIEEYEDHMRRRRQQRSDAERGEAEAEARNRGIASGGT